MPGAQPPGAIARAPLARRSCGAPSGSFGQSGWIPRPLPGRFRCQDDPVAFARRRVKEEGSLTLAGDLPPVVVEQHVMVPAEQYATVDVGAAVVTLEMVAVVGFAVRGSPLTVGPEASAV